MVFKPKFFLDLSGEQDKAQPAVVVAPVKVAPAKSEAPKQAAAQAKPAPAAAPEAATSEASAPKTSAGNLTTAEAIAAELAAEAAARPAPSDATFAPECLVPGASPRRRRRGSADLAGFRAMAKGMMRN